MAPIVAAPTSGRERGGVAPRPASNNGCAPAGGTLLGYIGAHPNTSAYKALLVPRLVHAHPFTRHSPHHPPQFEKQSHLYPQDVH